jgi:hypothetical protein
VASSARSCSLTSQRGLQLPGGIIGGEHGPQPVPGPVRECVPGAQEQPPVGPDRVDGASPPAMDLLREALPDLGEHVVAQLDQVKRVDRDSGARQPHPQGLAERRGRVDGNDLHAQAPLKRTGEQPVPTPPLSRPSTIPRTCPVSRSTMVVIHGS